MLLLLLLLQAEVTIPRTDKGDYPAVIKLCKEAQALIESDPRLAISKLDDVLANTKIKHIEVRIRIEERAGDTTEWYYFLPRQYRGRARINLAKSGVSDAEKLLEGAVEDLQASVDAKVASSTEHLDAATAALSRTRFDNARARWQKLIDARAFKSAKASLDGERLTDAQRAALVTETDLKCRTFLTAAAVTLRQALATLKSVLEVDSLSSEDFASKFALPKTDELCAPFAPIDWLRDVVALLDEQRRGRSFDASKLLAAVAAASTLESDGMNPWLKAVEAPVFGAVKALAGRASTSARDADAATRAKLRSEYDALMAAWLQFERALGQKVMERHPFVRLHGEELAQLAAAFPVDPAEIDAVDIEGALASKSPGAELVKIEAKLSQLTMRKDLSRDSRRKLFTALVTAHSLARFLDGLDEAMVAKEVEHHAEALRDAGGPIDPAKFGPRVQKVFEAIRR